MYCFYLLNTKRSNIISCLLHSTSTFNVFKTSRYPLLESLDEVKASTKCIQFGFEKSGIWPWNPKKVKSAEFKTSTKFATSDHTEEPSRRRDPQVSNLDFLKLSVLPIRIVDGISDQREVAI